MWQAILTGLFTFEEGYMIICRARVDSDSETGAAADVMLQKQKGQGPKPAILFTMSNKRASAVGDEQAWQAAKIQLGNYLAISRQHHTTGGMDPQHGAVAIGTRVRFYEYGKPPPTRNTPNPVPHLQLVAQFDVENHKEKVKRRLIKIKNQVERT
jgi:hypothetical protein